MSMREITGSRGQLLPSVHMAKSYLSKGRILIFFISLMPSFRVIHQVEFAETILLYYHTVITHKSENRKGVAC